MHPICAADHLTHTYAYGLILLCAPITNSEKKLSIKSAHFKPYAIDETTRATDICTQRVGKAVYGKT